MEKKYSKENLDAFYEYLSSISGYYNKLIPILKEELSIILSDKIDLLDKNLNAQQVYLLQTRNFDQQIAMHSLKLGIDGSNLTEMTLHLEAEDQIRFFDLLARFDITIGQVNFYKEKCKDLLESRLYSIHKILSAQDSTRDMSFYDKNASEIHGSSSSRSYEKKI